MNILYYIALFVLLNLRMTSMKYNSYVKISVKGILINACILYLIVLISKLFYNNEYFSTQLYEKKHNKVCVVTHVDYGDVINQLGALRYLASMYDEVVLCIKKGTKQKLLDIITTIPPIDSNTKEPNIVLHELNTENIYININEVAEEIKQYEHTHDIRCGGTFSSILDIPKTDENIFLFKLYKDLDIDISHYHNSTFIATLPESMDLYNKVKHLPYAFITTDIATGELFDYSMLKTKLNIDKDETLIVCSNKNIYTPEHQYYTLANEFVMKPFLWYVDTIKHATHVVLSDSSMFCLALHIPIETSECYVIPRLEGTDYSYLWDSANHYNPDSGKKVFKKL